MNIKYFIILGIAFLVSCNSGKNNSSTTLVNSTSTIIEEVVPTINTTSRIIENLVVGCSFDKVSEYPNLTYYLPREREVLQINDILKYSGLPSNFEVIMAPVANAMATMIDNKRYIIYDPSLLLNADYGTTTYWGSMFILAHEVGHHLSGHLFTTSSTIESNHVLELQADKFAGFVLYKMGASLDETLLGTGILGEGDSFTHPSKIRRIKSVEEGWNEANELRYSNAIPPIPNDDHVFESYCLQERNLIPDSYKEEYENGTLNFPYLSKYDTEGVIIKKLGNLEYEVYVTKCDPDEIDFIAENTIQTITLYDPFDSIESPLLGYTRALDSFMSPGRRIKFKYAVEGRDIYLYFYKISHLNYRDGDSWM